MIEFNHGATGLPAILGYEDKEALEKACKEEEGLGELTISVSLITFLITKEAAPMALLLDIIYHDANMDRPSNIVECLMPTLLGADDNKIKSLLVAIMMLAEGTALYEV